MIQLYTPSDPYQFQNIICDLFNYLEGTLAFQVYGRNGQGQDGIDVFSSEHKTVIQCGLRDINAIDKTNVKDLQKKLKEDLENYLKKNPNKVYKFYLASTFKDDKNLQDFANVLSLQHGIDVQYWGWGRISNAIERFPYDFRRKYAYLYSIDNPDIVLVTDKKYPVVPNYIPRTIRKTKLLGSESSVNINDLIALEETMILLLANPGMGKSIELEQLAHIGSHKEQLEFLPVFCELNRYKGDLEKLLESENIKWKHIASSSLLLLLDAMDEIQEQFRDSFITDIEQFCQLRPKSKVIISCRNNFKRNIKGFNDFELDDFSLEDVKKFLNGWEVNVQNVFWQQAKSNKIDDLLLTPFYLCALKQLFEANGYKHLPQGKAKILEELFELRLKQDKSKSGSLNEKITSRSLELKNSIQRIAISAESLGSNLLDDEDLQRIEKQYEIRELLKHSFLFNKLNTEEGKWQFEHNNFQEFLAAQVLAKQSIKTIKKYVSFEPQFSFFKPSWANTINLLISILDPSKGNKFNDLVEWLTQVQPDIFVRTEYYKLDIGIRQLIFKKIFNDAKEKGIWIERKYATLEELTKFSGGGIEIGRFLFDEIQEKNTQLSLLQAILLLGYVENISQLAPTITDLLKSIIINSENDKIGRELIGYVIETASRLKLRLDELSPEYLDKIGFNISSSIRASVYKYILSLDENEKHISILLDGIRNLKQSGMISPARDFRDEDGEPHNMSEELNLEKCLMAIQDRVNLNSVLDTLFADYRSTYRERIIQDIWPRLIENCVSVYQQSHEILPKITEHAILAFQHSRNNSYLESLKLFYEQTNTSNIFFDYCLEKAVTDWHHCISVFKTVSDKEQLDKIIQLYKSKKLNDNQILFGRAVFRDVDNELHKEFQELLVADYGDKFKYQEDIDYESERKKGEARDLKLLFNKHQFFKELFAAFDGFGRQVVDKDFIWDNYKSSNYHLDVVKSALLELAESFEIDREQLFEFQKRVDWDLYITHFIYKRIQNSTDCRFEEYQIQWISDWCSKEIKTANFKTSFYYDTETTYYSNPKCVYLIFFFLEFNLDFGQEKELEMLWYDSFAPRLSNTNAHDAHKSKLLIFLISKYGQPTVKETIINNLKEGIENRTIYITHWLICEELNITESLFSFTHYFSKQHLSDFDKFTLIKTFEKLEGDYSLIEQFILTNLTNKDWEWTLLEYLCKNGSKNAVSKILEILKKKPTLNDTEALHASYILAMNGQVQGFEYILFWAKTFKQCPPKHAIRSQALVKLDKTKSIKLLLEYFDLSKQIDYRERSWGNQTGEVSEALLEIGKSSDTYFNEIHAHFEHLIATHNPKENQNPIAIHYFIKELENRYYSNKSSQIELDDVLELNKLLAQ